MANSSSRYLPSRNTQYDFEKSPTRHLPTDEQPKLRRVGKLTGRRHKVVVSKDDYGSVRVRAPLHQSCTLENGTGRAVVQCGGLIRKSIRVALSWTTENIHLRSITAKTF